MVHCHGKDEDEIFRLFHLSLVEALLELVSGNVAFVPVIHAPKHGLAAGHNVANQTVPNQSM